jgi:hypothetical protein
MIGSKFLKMPIIIVLFHHERFLIFPFEFGGRVAVRASHCKGLPINCYQCLEGCEKITKKSAGVGASALPERCVCFKPTFECSFHLMCNLCATLWLLRSSVCI